MCCNAPPINTSSSVRFPVNNCRMLPNLRCDLSWRWNSFLNVFKDQKRSSSAKKQKRRHAQYMWSLPAHATYTEPYRKQPSPVKRHYDVGVVVDLIFRTTPATPDAHGAAGGGNPGIPTDRTTLRAGIKSREITSIRQAPASFRSRSELAFEIRYPPVSCDKVFYQSKEFFASVETSRKQLSYIRF